LTDKTPSPAEAPDVADDNTPLHRYRMVIEYDGTELYGWQFQPELPTVQGLLEDATQKLCGQLCRYQAAGRTDAGVHALGMVVHVDLPKHYGPFKVWEALNFFLMDGPVSILSVDKVDESFHARFSCTRRAYCYHMVSRRAPLSILRGKAWQVKARMNLDAMRDAAKVLIGTHDFTTFRNTECQSKSPVKTLDQLDISQDGDNIYFHVAARSFLHHQVRSMVGCLWLVGRGKWQTRDMVAALEARDRQALGYNAPPDGLYFLSADFDSETPTES